MLLSSSVNLFSKNKYFLYFNYIINYFIYIIYNTNK